MILRFTRFTQAKTLKSIGRDLLVRFFNSFAAELKACNVELPSPDLDDNVYFGSLARLLVSPEALPESVNEALFAVDELACPRGQEQLEIAIARSGLSLEFAHASSCADLAVQVWLADPSLLARVYNCHRMMRLSAFAHFGTNSASPEGVPAVVLNETAFIKLTQRLDAWFERHHRGQNTTRVERYALNGEHWFLIRHGDNFNRTPGVEAQQTKIIHFRPERDDVVVYSPEHDELRINARTKGEGDLYVKQFGLWLHGSEEYFSRHLTYTLEPLRTQGPDALDAAGIDGLDRIVLREVEVAWDDAGREVITRQADDIFHSVSAFSACAHGIPDGGRLMRATFDFHFKGRSRPHLVQIRVPNILKLARHTDLQPVNLWLAQGGFRVGSQ